LHPLMCPTLSPDMAGQPSTPPKKVRSDLYWEPHLAHFMPPMNLDAVTAQEA